MAWFKFKSHLNATWHGVGLGLGATWLKFKSNLFDMCNGLGLDLKVPPSPSPKCHVASVL